MSATGEAGPRLLPEGRSQAGTTLVEALVVVAITAMTAMVGFPRLQQSLVTLGQREAVAVVAADLRRARGDALRDDREAAFSVSGDGRVFGQSPGPWAHTPPGVVLAVGRPTARGGGSIRFFGDGSSSGGAIWIVAGRRAIPVFVSEGAGAIAVGAG